MSDYRRLISYIYEYEGKEKGKNVGFVKLEARGGQCRLSLNVKKIYVGGNAIGVFLLGNDKSEVFLGNLFVRGGGGEFRTTVDARNVENTGNSMDTYCGLTIHDVRNSWRSYTTIWEDSVGHTAQEVLPEAVRAPRNIAEVVKEIDTEIEKEITRAAEVEKKIEPETSGEEMREAENEPEDMEMQPQFSDEKQENGSSEADGGTDPGPDLTEADIRSEGEVKKEAGTFLPPESLAVSEAMPATDPELTDEALLLSESRSSVDDTFCEEERKLIEFPQRQSSEQSVRPTIRKPWITPTFMPQNGGTKTEAPGTGPFPVRASTAAPPIQSSGPVFASPLGSTIVRSSGTGAVRSSGTGSVQSSGAGSVQSSDSASAQSSGTGPAQSSGSALVPPSGSVSVPAPGALSGPPSASDRQSVQSPELENPEVLQYLQETEDLTSDPEKLWSELRRSYPKIQPFDYADGCEILTIRPQDIGRLPRECWVYGNNSFLLHGYYNFRYIILVRLGSPTGRARYLIGVPGHYYSNEKYMAAMFGFPNFVLSKKQPPNDGRFGYWYTDMRLR